MLSPPSISQGEALSSDNRKQVLRDGRHWEVMEGGEEERRTGGTQRLQVCRMEEIGEGDCVQKMLLHGA